jgi:hypothetical protein
VRAVEVLRLAMTTVPAGTRARIRLVMVDRRIAVLRGSAVSSTAVGDVSSRAPGVAFPAGWKRLRPAGSALGTVRAEASGSGGIMHELDVEVLAARAADALPEVTFEVLVDAELALVCGGRDQEIPAFGRCGPADRYQWLLGNIHTPECAEHDRRVRDALNAGKSKFEAHRDALPALGPAVGSWFRERFRGQ